MAVAQEADGTRFPAGAVSARTCPYVLRDVARSGNPRTEQNGRT